MRPFVVTWLIITAGCAPSRFDDLRDEAWSDSNGLPEGVESELYPVALAPLATGRPGAHIAVAGSLPATLATVSYDEEGAFDATGIPMPGVAEAISPVLAAVVDPDGGARNWVAAGGLGTTTIQIYDARSGANGPMLATTIDATACGGTGDLGRAMVWIRTDLGSAATPDLIAVAGHDLIAFTDLDPSVTTTQPSCVRCTVAASDIGGLAAADVMTDGGAELLLARHDPAGVANGEIAWFRASSIQLDDRGTCFATASPSRLTGDTVDYGTVIVAGDLDDNGSPEVAISSPSSGAVTIQPGLSGAGPSGPPLPVAEPQASHSFGVSLAIGDLDGTGRRELIVGDPQSMGDGVAFVFAIEAEPDLAQRAALQHGSPSFGGVVAVARFTGLSDDTDILVAGAAGRLVVYFRSLPAGVDPR